MDTKQKIELFSKIRGMFVIINDYHPQSSEKTFTISGKIEHIDIQTGDITLRNVSKNEIRIIPIDSFNNDFVIKELNGATNGTKKEEEGKEGIF